MKHASILVTGGAGFIGAHVVRQFLQEPESSDSSIVVLDDLSGGFAENVASLDRVELAALTETDIMYGWRYVSHASPGCRVLPSACAT